MIIDELIAILGYDVKGQENLDRFNRGMDQAQEHAERVASRINALSVAFGTFVGNMAADFARRIGSAIGSLPGDILDVGKKFEAYGIQLKALEGSQEAANKALDWISDFAKRTPLELDGVVAAYAQMRTFGLDPTNGSLQAMVDTMAMSGKGQEQLQGIILAVGQAWTAQKLQGQDAMQLMQRGVPVWDILSKAMGKSVAEVQKLSKAGKLGRKEIQMLIDEMGKRAEGASDEFAKSFEGITSNISDIWTGFLKQISDKGYYDNVKRRLSGVLETLDEWDKSGVLDKAADAISTFLSKSIDVGAHIGTRLWDIGKGAYYAADGIVSLISKVTGLNKAASAGILGVAVLNSSKLGRAALGALAKRIPALAALLLADDVIGGLKGEDSYIGTLPEGQKAIDGLRESLQGLGEAIKNLVPEWQALANTDMSSFMNQELVKFINGLTDAMRELAIIVTAIKQGDWKLVASMVLHGTDEENLGKIEEYQDRKDREGKARESQDGTGFKDILGNMGSKDPQAPEVEGGPFVKMLAAMERAAERPGGSSDVAINGPVISPVVEQPTVRPKVETPNVQPKVGPAVVKPSVKQPAIRAKVEQPTIKPKVETPTVRLPEVVAAPPARPAGVPVIQPVDATLASRKIASIADGIVAAGEMMRAAIEKASGYVAESAEAYAAERGSIRDKAAAANSGGENPLKAMLENMNANLAKMTPERAVQATVTDARQDNRQFPVTVNSTVNQTVTQATQAPAAAARATSQAVGQAAVPQAGRLAVDSAF